MITDKEQFNRAAKLAQDRMASPGGAQEGFRGFVGKMEQARVARERASQGISKKGKFGPLGDSKDKTKSPMSIVSKMGSFIQEIDIGQDGIYFGIIMISIIADIFTIFPGEGNIMAIFFAVLIWILYTLTGDFFGGKKINLKLGTNLGTGFFETFAPGLNALPAFTGAAILSYILVLAERAEEKFRHEEGDGKGGGEEKKN
ncbi:MAG TPA: hypothetical protein GX706_04245 [Candidatus Moranbacteria bacterium]|nr:hypothetical protein [Candidatus Moranbacteria bacterium]